MIPPMLHNHFHLHVDCSYRDKEAKPGNHAKSNALSEIGKHWIWKYFQLDSEDFRKKVLSRCVFAALEWHWRTTRQFCLRSHHAERVPELMRLILKLWIVTNNYTKKSLKTQNTPRGYWHIPLVLQPSSFYTPTFLLKWSRAVAVQAKMRGRKILPILNFGIR
jgi:hypothetical protein